MSPITHFLAGWAAANVVNLERRDRFVVTMSAISPDLDALGIIGNIATRNTPNPVYWWEEYHHVLGHNLGFALAVTVAAFLLARRRFAAALLALASVHLHLLGDLVGARGPEGYQWPIPYLEPFSDAWSLVWEGQWFLNAWPNFLITGTLLVLALYLAWKRGYSPLDMVSGEADRAFVDTLRVRFGEPR